jgi:hypothetical protein
MNLLFYIFWISELMFLVYMWIDEMKLKYLSMPMYIPLGFFWILVAALVKWGLKHDKAALVMVTIPGIPLLIMGVFLVVIFIVNVLFGPIRWQ